MKDLQKWEPFLPFAGFEDFFFPKRKDRSLTVQDMPVEIKRGDGKIFVDVKIPGAKKEDVSVTVNEESITVQYKKTEQDKKEENIEGESIYYSEFLSSEEMQRTIRLPEKIDSSAAKASMDDGVLKIAAPVLSKSTENKLMIE